MKTKQFFILFLLKCAILISVLCSLLFLYKILLNIISPIRNTEYEMVVQRKRELLIRKERRKKIINNTRRESNNVSGM